MSISSECAACRAGNYRPFIIARDRMFGGDETFLYERCTSCGMLRQHPVLSESQVKRFYPPRSYYSYQEGNREGLFDRLREYLIGRYYTPTMVTRLLTMIIPNVPAIPSFVKNGNVLDIGCGSGDTLASLQSLGWNVYGIDIDRSAVRLAQKRGLKNVTYGSFRDMKKFPDRFFDAIRLYHVIEHLNDPDLCLTLIRNKLKKGGEVIVGTPNAGSLVARAFGSYWYNLDAPRHAFVYTPEALRNMLVRYGFAVSDTEFCSAGGIVGSLQYIVCEKTRFRALNLLSHAWFVMLVYPFEWLLDKIRIGDIFVIRANKNHL